MASLSGDTDWPSWKRKIRDLLDYQENALAVIGNKITKPEPLGENANNNELKEFKKRSDAFRKANSFRKNLDY